MCELVVVVLWCPSVEACSSSFWPVVGLGCDG